MIPNNVEVRAISGNGVFVQPKTLQVWQSHENFGNVVGIVNLVVPQTDFLHLWSEINLLKLCNFVSIKIILQNWLR